MSEVIRPEVSPGHFSESFPCGTAPGQTAAGIARGTNPWGVKECRGSFCLVLCCSSRGGDAGPSFVASLPVVIASVVFALAGGSGTDTAGKDATQAFGIARASSAAAGMALAASASTTSTSVRC